MHLVFTLIMIIPYAISLILPVTKRDLIKTEENRMNNSNNFNISHSFKLPSINICIGSPSQCVDVIIDTFAYIGWISGLEVSSPHPFNEEKSTTYTQTSSACFSYDYNSFYILGKPSIDILKINDNIISPNPDFAFLLSFAPKKFPILSVDGIMGLSRKLKYKTVNSKAISLMEYLYQNKIINKKVFTFVNYKHSDKGQFFIGELPDHFNITSSFKCQCLLPRNLNDQGWLDEYWNCNLRMILFKKKNETINFMLNQPIFFKTGNNFIILTEGQKHLLQLLTTGDILRDKSCVIEGENNELFISCELFNVESLGDIIFRINDLTELVLKSEDLFMISEKNSSRMESIIRVYRDASYMVIGNALLKNYDISFDMENSIIYFQESREEPTIKIDKFIFYLFYFIISILVFAIILLSISIWKGKTMSKINENINNSL